MFNDSILSINKTAGIVAIKKQSKFFCILKSISIKVLDLQIQIRPRQQYLKKFTKT